MRAAWTSYVAIGDSFTEGLDDLRDDGTPRGWADRVAERLAQNVPDFRYANLAVRGKLIDQIVADQVPIAEQLRPDLITFSAGGNDIIRPRCDPDSVAERCDAALARLVSTGADVVIFAGFDTRKVPVLSRLRGRIATFNELLRAIADKHGCRIVDLWAMAPLSDPRSWGRDRLHLTPDGHRRVSLRTLEVLGIPVTEDWREPLADPVQHPWLRRRQEDLDWTRNYLLPFLSKWARGHQTGDGFQPKRPELMPYIAENPPGGAATSRAVI
ncbi:SGNH/GDSL hydrolase family protein [Pseudonocardia acaciae]|uniref:SGNH/GDSL hydrolase family protein n=1 Tax=Pseudonocardia acaciae TaxID=551276 RepID=UPI000AC0A292|nr:SGNH/GDSL hydrolase family protein [Pseudonocardia acaciae]